MKTLADIFRKANPPAVPLRLSVREVGQKKLQEMNQEGTQMKITPPSNPVTNVNPLRVHIVEAYPDELQPVNQAKHQIFFQLIRSQHLTAKSEKLPNMRFGKIKADTSVPLTHVITEKKNTKRASSEGQE